MGWIVVGSWEAWESPDGETYKPLPPIDSQWEVTARFLVPFMRQRGFNYCVDGYSWKLGMRFNWQGQLEGQPYQESDAEIKDDNIAEAACKAFMEVEL